MAFAQENLVSGLCLNQIPMLRVPQGGTTAFDLTVIDRETGLPKDLTSGGSIADSEITSFLTAIHTWNTANAIFKVAGVNVCTKEGRLSFTIGVNDTARPGIYTASLTVCIGTVITHMQPYYIEIEPHDRFRSVGTPTIVELRLFLRDTCPESNFLLDEVEFSDAEYAACVRLPVDQFNEEPPELDMRFTTEDFPFRYNWIQATIGLLLRIAASHYRRNKLTYSAGGITIDPQADKSKEYELIATQRMQKWEKFIDEKKREMNTDAGYGIVQSPYSYLWGSSR